MSKALRYLATVRPEAATHLLSFYKHSVQSLDDKTRHLIQIVTKVTVGTERGLRQYAPKALKSGASKEEILDAVLMAFPAAGLNKVLDAIDVLNDLDLLPQAVDAKQDSAKVEKNLGSLQTFPIGQMKNIRRPEGDLIVFRLDEEHVKVYSARCPHSKASLCDGTDHGDRVECRVHNWVFDLKSGTCLDPEGKQSLKQLESTLQEGDVVLV